MNFKERLVIEQAATLSGKTVPEFISTSAYIRAKYLLAKSSRLDLDKASYSVLRNALEPSSENRTSTTANTTHINHNRPAFPIEKLDIRHELEEFNCGNDGLNIWLTRLAIPYQFMEIAETYVIPGEKHIRGYYTLTKEYFQVPNCDFSFEAVVLLHLAVDQQFQGKGCGQALTQNVINRFIAEEQPNSPKLLLVQAEQISLRKWYQNMGFNPLPTESLILFLSRT